MVILDTCAVIELCKSESHFSTKISEQIQEGAFLLSISFAEIACKVKLGKLTMNITPEDLYFDLANVINIEIIKIGVEEWLDAINLDWKANKDPADRLITAFAMKKQIPIVTSDKHIKSFYKKVLW